MSNSEAATKKKRGRPRKYEYFENDREYQERKGRNLQNYANAATLVIGVLIRLSDEADNPADEYDYISLASAFCDDVYLADHEGASKAPRFKYQGVAEQIGRMYNAGRIDKQEAVELTRQSLRRISEYGHSSKDVEKWLREYHKGLKAAGAAKQ